MGMNVACLDLEGVLVPEIWIAFSEASGIPELKKTTRDEPDYDKLMNWRIGILNEHGLGLKEIQETIAKIDPLPGAKEFLDELRSVTQTIIISDTLGNVYELEGIVTLNQDNDIAILKVKTDKSNYVSYEEVTNIEKGNSVISMNSRTGIGLTSNKGLIISINKTHH